MNIKVLVADDSATERFYISRQLDTLYVRCDMVSGGKEALKQTLSEKYDIIFLDCAMPEPDGGMTLARLKQNPDNPNFDTKVVYMGSVPEHFAIPDGGFLKKPVMRKALEDKINELTAGRLSAIKPASYDGTSEVEALEVGDNHSAEAMPYLPPELWDNAAGIDVTAGIEHCGSEDGYLAALDIYLGTLKEKADEIDRYYRNEDYESYTIKVHALKSSSRIIGADALADKAYALEMAGHDGDTDRIKNETEGLLADYRAIYSILAPILHPDSGEDDGNADNGDMPEIDQATLIDAYASIAEFADAMEFDLTKMVLNSIQGYKMSDKDAKKVESIHTKLLNLDWDGIKEIISQ